MNETDAKTAALALLRAEKTGVLATLSADGQPRARPIHFASDNALQIYFLTFANTRKADDLRTNQKAAFTVSDKALPRALQIEGTVADITNSPVDDAIIEELFDNLQMNTQHYTPIARFDRGDVRLFRLTPTWARYGDFTEGHTTAEVLFELPV